MTTQANWWPYSAAQVKKFILVLFTTCTAVGGTVWGVLEFMVDPMVEAKVQELQQKRSRWDITGDLIGTSGDMVPYEIKQVLITVDSLVAGIDRFERIYRPWLDTWTTRTLLVPYTDSEGHNYYNWRDNRGHPVVQYENGYPWIIYAGQRVYPIPIPKPAPAIANQNTEQ